jgi:hypothetical protein
MKRLTLRGIDEELEEELQKRAEHWSCSLNSTILRLLRDATGQSERKFARRYGDLDDLAGTWTEEQKEEFDELLEPLSHIDKELWQ